VQIGAITRFQMAKKVVFSINPFQLSDSFN